MNAQTQYVRLTKRLSEADGYIDLGMSQHALNRLDGIGAAGPFAPAVAMLRGKALWQQKRFDEAAKQLREAADGLSTPMSRQAWLALSLYYQRQGDVEEAVDALSKARGANPTTKRSTLRPGGTA
ncbi:MAG: tetratricopeptide repeat protein [Pirellulales bacterium]|nr:tetratricopeptide repeat protein [Pirellulales bacterium]